MYLSLFRHFVLFFMCVLGLLGCAKETAEEPATKVGNVAPHPGVDQEKLAASGKDDSDRIQIEPGRPASAEPAQILIPRNSPAVPVEREAKESDVVVRPEPRVVRRDVRKKEVAQHAHTQQAPAKFADRQNTGGAVVASAKSVTEEATLRHVLPGVPPVPPQVSGSGTLQNLSGIRAPAQPIDRENYAHFDDSGVFRAAETPVSTFSIDVDTGSYTLVRRMLNEGRLPVRDAVRTEELINYFDYEYPQPRDRSVPFSVNTEIGPAPWDASASLLQIGIKGYQQNPANLPPTNLVFLIDVSGSMRSPDKLDLLKSSLKLLAYRLRPQDRVAIAVYAGASGLVLQPTSGANRNQIVAAIDRLSAGGRTNGAAGIQLAYQVARQNFVHGGVNRVILATDGDFNVGTVNIEALKGLIAEQRKSGISLTTLGFGRGNYNDHLMEQLADIGNGNYAYVDRLAEAQKVLVDEVSGTLHTIASDVKIQVEFNPALVSEYRLIGYENRALKREDFNNDRIDAGEIGAGHTVTALYEVRLHGKGGARIDPLRYGPDGRARPEFAPPQPLGELAHLRMRYKLPGQDHSRLIERPVQVAQIRDRMEYTSEQFRFAAAVASFGQLLRGGSYTGNLHWNDVMQIASGARGRDPKGYRGEFVQMVQTAASISGQQPPVLHD